MLIAAGEAGKVAFDWFDVFMVAFTLILLWALIRQVKQRPRNLFALGFAAVSLLTFVLADVVMVCGYLGITPPDYFFFLR
ncbi:hypothetical protein NQ117_14195 [Paenibacillus sp. SC116]|uniref:hypothetical protein n=1 Tax=Paenibacillus sp. SC116 TaxID=2968986 RepID=UPI00215A70E3|nr:hypothetical protein [Paenibacillus sp. SC116]MCR8844839.1 hypothetical protein [Paenibacillus sp. SC116]